jgi:hypothetical protein
MRSYEHPAGRATAPAWRALPLLAVLLVPTLCPAEPAFERTLDVEPDSRLSIEIHAGFVHVRGWDQPRLELKADYGPRQELEVRRAGKSVYVEVRTEDGPPGMADVEIRVPRLMAIFVEGYEVDVEMSDVGGELDIHVVNGDIYVRGGAKRVELRSIHGSVELADGDGQIYLQSTNDDVLLRDCRGDIVAETVNGDIRMEGIVSSAVEAITTNGDILYDGSLEAEGDYGLTTHDGDVLVSVSPDANLEVTIATFDGGVDTDFEAKMVETRPGKRFQLILGAGQGKLRVESFSGDISLYDPKRGRSKRG